MDSDKEFRITKTKLQTAMESMDVSLYCAKNGEQCLILTHEPLTSPTYLRLQSACLFGETFHSTECDCRQQIDGALERIAKCGGVFVYLFQEGRGAGLEKKMRAMALQKDSALSSERAYEHLGIPFDSRDYAFAAEVLKNHVLAPGTKLILLGENERK